MPTPDFLTLLGPIVCLLGAASVAWQRRTGDRNRYSDEDFRPAGSRGAYLSLALFGIGWFILGMLIRAFPSR